VAAVVKRIWAWIVGLLLALLGVVGIVAAVERRKTRKATKLVRKEIAVRAKKAAQVSLDAAVQRGIERVSGADSSAEEIVDDSGGTLGQYLVERDPGDD